MSGVEFVPHAAQPVMPWANGGGSTRQVAIEPRDGSLARGFLWRVSMAHVASDGPFSLLPGVDRSLWLLDGAGLELTVAGGPVVLDAPLQRFDFDGGDPVHARLLAGPCTDLNVMVARARCQAAFELRSVGPGWSGSLEVGATAVVVVLAGTLQLPGAGVVAARLDALRIAPQVAVAAVAGAAGARWWVARFLPC
jgi:environmental stress-induced protein Ves